MKPEKKWVLSDPLFESDLLNQGLKTDSWAGHRYFAYDLMRFMRPAVLLELGTHYGGSFFAFCQAIKDHALTTRIVAVDHWRGDEHAGFYGEEVFELVNKTIITHFEAVNIELKRMDFDRAVMDFDDASIDLIHIDGLHTYEAVKHDFETWLPKLAPNGVILFHDVAEYTGFGSPIFWSELKAAYKYNMEFSHSFGLGVLFPKGAELYEAMLSHNFDDKFKIYTCMGSNEVNREKLAICTQSLEEHHEAVQKMPGLMRKLKSDITRQREIVETKEKHIEWQRKMIEEQKETIKELREKLEAAQKTIP